MINPPELGVEVFYPDTGCEYAKAKGYRGTCLPSKDCAGCPFPECLLIVHTKDYTRRRDNEIRELNARGIKQVEIAKLYSLSKDRIFQIVHAKGVVNNG
jgi:hypothetical protein